MDNNTHSSHIPSVNLVHNDEETLFAIRTMEYIWKKTGGKPDKPHRHNYYTILWSKHACGKHHIDYREYKIAPNYVFFVSPGQVHQVVLDKEPQGFVIMFTTQFLLEQNINLNFFSNLGLFHDHPDMPPLPIDDMVSNKLEMIGNEINNIFESKQNYKNESLGAWLKLFMIECNKVTDGLENCPEINNHSNKQLVASFKTLVEDNFKDWHKVSEYAVELNVTADHLNNVIKRNINTTAKEFIQERILLEAKRLGVHTDLSSKEIGFQIGFEDPAHFSKFFKRASGESFSDFRKSLVLS